MPLDAPPPPPSSDPSASPGRRRPGGPGGSGGPGGAGGAEDPGDRTERAPWDTAWLHGRRAGGLLFLLLAATALAIYHGALPVQLGSDARFLTYRNDWVADPGGIFRFWTADFFEGSRTHAFPYLSGYYRPITNTVFWLEYRWAGSTDLLYNLGEVLLHGLNAFLVFLVVGRLLEDRLAGALAGLLWVVHPVHAMAATEPAARGDLLFAAFYLLGLWVFDGGLRGMAGAEGGGMAWRAWAAAGLYALSLLSKEMGATFPAALVLLVLYRRFRNGISWRATVWTLPAWGFFGAYLAWRFGVLGLVPPDLGYAEAHPTYAVLLAALKTIPIHLSRILLPLGAAYPELNPELVNFVSDPFAQPLTYAALLVAGGLLGVALLWKRHPVLAFCSAFFLVTYTPLLRVENIAGSLGRDVVLTQERWIYLPAVAVTALLGLGAARFLRKAGEPGGWGDREPGQAAPTPGQATPKPGRATPKPGRATPKPGRVRRRARQVAVAAGLGVLLVLLGTSAAAHAGQHDSPYAQLRSLYLIPEERLGRMQVANKRLLYANWVAVPMGDLDEAERRARDALALAPDSPIVAYSAANVLAEAGKWEEVARILEPWEAPSPEELREHARTYVRVYDDLNRNNAAIVYLLGRARAHLGEGSEGARLLCTAFRRGISEEDVERALGELWAFSGPPDCAASGNPAGCAARASEPPPAFHPPLEAGSCRAWETVIEGVEGG